MAEGAEGRSMTRNRIHGMRPSEVTIELIDTGDSLGEYERRIIRHAIDAEPTTHEQPRSTLRDAAGLAGDFDSRLALYVGRRLQRGLQDYGPADPARDSRDFEAEALEELADAYVYLSMHHARAGKPSAAMADVERCLRRLMVLALKGEAV